MGKSIFISKDRKEVDEFADFLKADNAKLIAHSFLSFKAIDFSINVEYSVVFFGSPRAVFYFFESSKLLPHTKIACVGRGTAKAVIEKGFTPHFIGDETDINLVASNFKAWCENRVVLFPTSSISLKTVSSLFVPKQKVEVIVYETSMLPARIPPCSVYVFTSPSNVEGFLMQNKLPDNARIISWGKSTANLLTEMGVESEVLSEPSVESLIFFISSTNL